MTAEAKDDPRAELAGVAASLRAYLEWQTDTGATGIPRARRASRGPADAPTGPAMARPQGSAPVNIEPARLPASRAEPPRFEVALADIGSPDALPDLAPLAAAPAIDMATAPAPAPAPMMQPPPQAVAPVPTLARLPVLADEVASCTRCVLSTTRTNTVFARGNPSASLCFVGEGPGADEDATGIPFVGRAGQLLDRMIGAMGLDPARDVYVCNIVKCRPPGNRRPEPDEMAACIPYLHEQLAIVNPKVIVALGNTAVAALLGAKAGITKVRGSWKLYKGGALVMPTYHPSYLLRPGPTQAEAKRQAWDDLQAVMKELKLPLPPKKS